MNVLFKLFERGDETAGIEQQLRDYNIRFDDNRSIMRSIIELPYVLERIKRFVCSAEFIVFFLRSVHLLRMFLIVIVYILMPFDLIPEHLVGVIGYIDDILLGIIIILFFIAIAAVQFMRNRV
jgi:RING finger protein 170